MIVNMYFMLFKCILDFLKSDWWCQGNQKSLHNISAHSMNYL